MKQGKVLVGGSLELRCLVPETDVELRRGLEGLAGLGDSEAMLFLYDAPKDVFIHMAGVTFPLDVVFVREGAVIGISHNVQPGVQGRMYAFADAVLELPGSWCRRHYVEPGTVVELRELA